MDAAVIIVLVLVGLLSFLGLWLYYKSKNGTKKIEENRFNFTEVKIFFATQTGTAKGLAGILLEDLSSLPGLDCRLLNLKDCSDPEEILSQAVRCADSQVRVCANSISIHSACGQSCIGVRDSLVHLVPSPTSARHFIWA